MKPKRLGGWAAALVLATAAGMAHADWRDELHKPPAPERELSPGEKMLHHAAAPGPELPGDFLYGVYSDEPGCVSGIRPNSDTLYLTRDGLSGLAYGCDFLSLESDGDAASFVAEAECSTSPPGTTDRIRVTATAPLEGPAGEVLVEFEDRLQASTYYHCPGG